MVLTVAKLLANALFGMSTIICKCPSTEYFANLPSFVTKNKNVIGFES